MNIRRYALVERALGTSDRNELGRYFTRAGAKRARRALVQHFAGSPLAGSVIWYVSRGA